MAVYIALLRGINVSGQRLIKMADLKRVFEEMGLGRVQTYIQSGNVVFESAAEADSLRRRIEAGIETAFGHAVPTVVRAAADFTRIIAECPYAADALAEGESLYVALLSAAPDQAGIERLLACRCDSDECRVVGREVYLLLRQGAGNTKLTNTLLEKKLGVSATSRNWQTINKLYQLAKAMAT